MFWSIVVPGMTEDQAERLLSFVREVHGLEGSTVNPEYFLSWHLDRHSAEVVKKALSAFEASGIDVESRGVGRGLREAVDDWIDAGGKYL